MKKRWEVKNASQRPGRAIGECVAALRLFLLYNNVTGFVVGLIRPIFPPFMVLTVLVGCSRRRSACGSRGLGDGSNKHFCILYTQMPCLPLLCPCKLCRWLSTSRSCWGDPNPQNTMLICPGAELLYDHIVQHISAFVVGLVVLVFCVFVAQIGPVCSATISFYGFLPARAAAGGTRSITL